MIRHRLFAASLAAVAAFFVAGPALSAASADTSTSTSSTSSTTEPVATVTAAPNGIYSVTLPGIGALVFTVDPTSHAISGVTATALPGFIAGAPTVTEDGVTVLFTGKPGPNGAPAPVFALKAEVSQEDGVTVVTADAEAVHQDNEADGANGESDGPDDQAPAVSGPTTTEQDTEHDTEQAPSSSTKTTEHPDHESSTGAAHEGGQGAQDGSGQGGSGGGD